MDIDKFRECADRVRKADDAKALASTPEEREAAHREWLEAQLDLLAVLTRDRTVGMYQLTNEVTGMTTLVTLQQASTIMALDEEEIEFNLEDSGECGTDEFTLIPLPVED